jgi:hypothetical protein
MSSCDLPGVLATMWGCVGPCFRSGEPDLCCIDAARCGVVASSPRGEPCHGGARALHAVLAAHAGVHATERGASTTYGVFVHFLQAHLRRK